MLKFHIDFFVTTSEETKLFKATTTTTTTRILSFSLFLFADARKKNLANCQAFLSFCLMWLSVRYLVKYIFLLVEFFSQKKKKNFF